LAVLDESGISQEPQVLADRRSPDRELCGQLANGSWSGGQQFQNAPADWLT
jgi:hypothetical protein